MGKASSPYRMGFMKFTTQWMGWGVAVALAGCGASVPKVQGVQEGRQVKAVQEVAEPAAPPIAVSAPVTASEISPPLVAVPPAPTRAVVTDAVARRRPVPRYPPGLAEEGPRGAVVVSFAIGAKGQPEDVRIEYASHALFAKEVMAVLPAWRYEPARAADGSVVRTRMRVPFRFQAE